MSKKIVITAEDVSRAAQTFLDVQETDTFDAEGNFHNWNAVLKATDISAEGAETLRVALQSFVNSRPKDLTIVKKSLGMEYIIDEFMVLITATQNNDGLYPSVNYPMNVQYALDDLRVDYLTAPRFFLEVVGNQWSIKH